TGTAMATTSTPAVALAGNLQVLAALSDERIVTLPAVPTMRELGFPAEGFTAGGLIAPISCYAAERRSVHLPQRLRQVRHVSAAATRLPVGRCALRRLAVERRPHRVRCLIVALGARGRLGIQRHRHQGEVLSASRPSL